MSLTIREEKILEAAVAGEQSPIEPVTRREAIFAKATGADVELPPARNKEEDILSKLAVGYAEGGGGESYEPFIVTGTSVEGTVMTFDKSLTEIRAAMQSGKIPVVQVNPELETPITKNLWIIVDATEENLTWTLGGNIDSVSVADATAPITYNWD